MSPDLDERWMREALDEARLAADHGDVPIGAVIVLDDQVVGRGRNERVLRNDPLAHAEIVALQDAAKRLGHWRLDHASLFVTLEPCPMCAGAITQARLRETIFGARDDKAGAARSVFQILDDPRLPHRTRVREGILADDCAALLRAFFEDKRARRHRPSSGPTTGPTER